MRLSLITLCSVCCVLLSGNVFAEKVESQGVRRSSIGKFIKDVNDAQRTSDEQYRKVRELSPKWFAAAESGDLEEMKALWDEAFKYNLYIRDDSERTALEIAITKGHSDMVKWLADRTDEQEEADRASNFNLQSSNKDHKSMMVVAAENGYEDIVKIMLLRLMDPNVYKDMSAKNMGKTPLIVAAENGHTDVVDLLLTSKNDPKLLQLGHARADPNIQDFSDKTALMYAAENGHEDIVKLLLDNKADPDKKDKWGDTALILATCSEQESIVKLLLKHEANVNIKNGDKETALIWAAKRGSLNIAKMLLEKGAKIKTKDKKGKTALDYAEKDAEMTELLMDYIDRPENQDKGTLVKRAWNKITKKKDLINGKKEGKLKNRRLSADSNATLYEEDTGAGRDIDDLLSSTDTLVED